MLVVSGCNILRAVTARPFTRVYRQRLACQYGEKRKRTHIGVNSTELVPIILQWRISLWVFRFFVVGSCKWECLYINCHWRAIMKCCPVWCTSIRTEQNTKCSIDYKYDAGYTMQSTVSSSDLKGLWSVTWYGAGTCATIVSGQNRIP